MKSVIFSEQPVLLEKPSIWYRLILWMLLLITSSGFLWAYFARIEQVVPAQGDFKLKDGSVDIIPPTGASTVVRLHVEEGDRVVKNQPILTFSPTAPSAQFDALKKVKQTLEEENKFYQDVTNGNLNLGKSPELDALIRDREARIIENQTFDILINELYFNRPSSVALNPTQQALYANYTVEYRSRIAAVQTQIAQSEQQLKQAEKAELAQQELLKNAQSQLNYSRLQLQYSEQQLRATESQVSLDKGQLDKSQDVLKSNQQILGNMEPLGDTGAIAQLQIEQQRQQVLRGQSEVLRQEQQIKTREGEISTRQGEINSRRSDINAKEGEISKITAEIERLRLEQERIKEAINQGKEQLQNTKDAWAKDLYTRIADNQKQLASLDSQLSRYQLENKKRLSEVDSQIAQVGETRDTQVLKAPVPGVIFDLKPIKKENSKLGLNTDPICQYVINSVLKPGDPRPARCEESYYQVNNIKNEPLLKILDDKSGLQGIVFVENKYLALVLDALRHKREKLQKYDGKVLAKGEKIECGKDKSCSCPLEEENLQKLGLTPQDCIPVEVQVEAFPATEYGTIPGELIDIGKDAIEPTQLRQFYAFKTTIRLKRQYFLLDKNEDLRVKLQAGMAINANINIGKRSVLDLFISRFTGKLDSVKRVR